MARAAALLLALSTAWAATKEDDKVTSIPGFEAQFQQGLGFDVYSGYLDVDVPKAWEESDPKYIASSDEVKLRSFTTKVHKVDTMVSYKADM